MKIETKQESALIVGAETTQFGLNLKDPSIFVQMLMNLYSDPIGSSVREYLSNAWDANRESGTDKPIVVGLENNKFWIQDYGNGLSPDFMNSSEEGYCTIGYSTKRNSNEMIGAYGFGRMTFLAYNKSQYWVNTVYEGIAYEYLIFLDGNTIKQTLLKKEETDEPSGTRVVVQLKNEWREKEKWETAIREQAQYFEGTLISIDSKVEKVEVTKDVVWTSTLDESRLHFILGCVYYEIDWKQFSQWEFLQDLRGGIHIRLDEGIFPTPNRESLVMDTNSISKLNSKFEKLAEHLWKRCEEKLKEVQGKKEILRLQFLNSSDFPWGLSYLTYRKICALLNKVPIEIDPANYNKNGAWIYRQIAQSFDKTKGVYCDSWSKLKLEYLQGLGKSPVKRRNQGRRDWSLRYSINTDVPKEEHVQECEKIKDRLLKQYIEETFEIFPEQDFLEWKKSRKGERKERGKGLTYYRAQYNNAKLCTEDRGDIDLSKFPCLFKASKETAQKYWTFLNSIYKNKLMINKTEGYDLDKLEPSPFLKRMCTEALKTKVYDIIGKPITSKYVLELIEELNPLLHQYIIDVGINKMAPMSISQEALEALVEAGELLGFGQQEVKLKYIQYHLNKLKLLGKLGVTDYYNGKKFTQEDRDIIKRVYILERLVEKKKLEVEQSVESINENQLQLELV